MHGPIMSTAANTDFCLAICSTKVSYFFSVTNKNCCIVNTIFLLLFTKSCIWCIPITNYENTSIHSYRKISGFKRKRKQSHIPVDLLSVIPYLIG